MATTQPTITSAKYDFSLGKLDVTGTGFLPLAGADNDIDVSKLTIQGDFEYTLTSNSVEIISDTNFVVVLNSDDQSIINQIIDKDGNKSLGETIYNLMAAEGWAAGADNLTTSEDLFGNEIFASNVGSSQGDNVPSIEDLLNNFFGGGNNGLIPEPDPVVDEPTPEPVPAPVPAPVVNPEPTPVVVEPTPEPVPAPVPAPVVNPEPTPVVVEPTPEPVPAPVPAPVVNPEPAPVVVEPTPEPVPAPVVNPEPTPVVVEPTPEPVPAPVPAPVVNPEPTPVVVEPTPEPVPAPIPAPVVNPEPTPVVVEPTPEPVPAPVPAPVVNPEPTPVVVEPTPEPVPAPIPAPVVNPEPTPVVVEPTPEPVPAPVPAPVVNPEPAPVVNPEPAPVVVEPTPEPIPAPIPTPVVNPEPTPVVVEPTPEPIPAPIPTPVVNPEPTPVVVEPTPEPIPAPIPAPVVNPEPTPVVVEPTPETVPAPIPAPVVNPEPTPDVVIPLPAPEPVPSVEPNPVFVPAPEPVIVPVEEINPKPVPSPVIDPIFNQLTTLKFSKVSYLTQNSTELGVFEIDNEQGNINGVTPGQTGYLAEVLKRSQVVFSTLGSQPDDQASRHISVTSGARLGFYLVKDATTEELKLGANKTVLFSFPNNDKPVPAQVIYDTQIAFKDVSGNGNQSTNDVVVKIESASLQAPLGIAQQGNNKIFDLTSVVNSTGATFEVKRNATYNNHIGFYKIEDAEGTIKIGTSLLRPGDVGYREAVVQSRIAGVDLTGVNDQALTTSNNFEGGAFYAPFLISNSSTANFDYSNVFTAYSLGNADKADHIRLLADNTFGFEDLYGGGDRDFNDMIVKATFGNVPG